MTLRTNERPFLLCAWRAPKPCPTCDEEEAGLFTRIDHGCTYEEELAAHKTLLAARLHGGRIAKGGVSVTVYDGDGAAVWAL